MRARGCAAAADVECGRRVARDGSVDKPARRSADESERSGRRRMHGPSGAGDDDRRALRARARGAPALAGCALLLLSGDAGARHRQSTGDGMGTITPPADDPGFDHVGVTGNGLSGIYLGNRWYLDRRPRGRAVDHARRRHLSGDARIAGPAPALARRLSRTLALVRLVTASRRWRRWCSSSTPPVSSGRHRHDDRLRLGPRGASQTCWNASFARSPAAPFATFRGYEAVGPFRMRWGRNLVNGARTSTSPVRPW